MIQKVRIIDMVIDYGRPRAAAVVKKAVENTIRETQAEMRRKKYFVVSKPIIPGRLESYSPHPLCKIDSHGCKSAEFYEPEVEAMRKTMPAFDKYFEVVEA